MVGYCPRNLVRLAFLSSICDTMSFTFAFLLYSLYIVLFVSNKFFTNRRSLFAYFCAQRIDGFLAVLSITGGNFSPKSQKLPFAVTSIEGDNYLLYYSSIDLAGTTESNKSRGSKMKRSLSIEKSGMENSRLRVPMKGRIQLVTDCFDLCH